MYLSERIAHDYQTWKSGDVILITAPTGAGKSYFIQHEYLKWMIKERRGKILYLVNRQILKKQMEEELKETLYDIQDELEEAGANVPDLSEYIRYETYQYIETLLCEGHYSRLEKLVKEYDVIVYDEAHYFMADSTFNAYTELSYDYLRQIFDKGIQIYMSATMDSIKDKIKKDCLEITFMPNVSNYGYNPFRQKQTVNIKDGYVIDKNYDYVNTRLISSMEELITEIIIKYKAKKKKWLVFIDNIEKGKNLKTELCSGSNSSVLSKEDVIVIEAGNSDEEDVEEERENIQRDNKFSKKIVITTPVMDNGISLYDDDLENIVIMTDIQETFIQMLGRKREKNYDEKINLYLMKRDVQHFKARLRYVRGILDEYDNLKKHFEEKRMYCIKQTRKEEIQILPEYQGAPYIDDKERWYMIEYCPGFLWCDIGQYYANGENWFEYTKAGDERRVAYINSQILHKMMKEPSYYKILRRFTYIKNSFLYENKFAVNQFQKQAKFYHRMIKALKQDEYAFYKEQCSWLGQIKEIEHVKEDSKSSNDCKIQKINTVLEQQVGIEMNADECKKFKNESYREDLLEFIENTISYEPDLKDIHMLPLKRTSADITVDDFNTYMEIAELPYQMISKSKNPKIVVIEHK